MHSTGRMKAYATYNYEQQVSELLNRIYPLNSLTQDLQYLDQYQIQMEDTEFYKYIDPIVNKKQTESQFNHQFYVQINSENNQYNLLRGLKSSTGPQQYPVQYQLENRRRLQQTQIGLTFMMSDHHGNIVRLILPNDTQFYVNRAQQYLDFNNFTIYLPQNQSTVLIQTISFQNDIEFIDDFQMLTVVDYAELKLYNHNTINDSASETIRLKFITQEIDFDINQPDYIDPVSNIILQYMNTKYIHFGEYKMAQYYNKVAQLANISDVIQLYNSAYHPQQQYKQEDLAQLMQLSQQLSYQSTQLFSLGTNHLQYLYLYVNKYIQILITVFFMVKYLKPSAQDKKSVYVFKLITLITIILSTLLFWNIIASIIYILNPFECASLYVFGMLLTNTHMQKSTLFKIASITFLNSMLRKLQQYELHQEIIVNILQVYYLVSIITEKQFLKKWLNQYTNKEIFNQSGNCEQLVGQNDWQIQFLLFSVGHPQFANFDQKLTKQLKIFAILDNFKKRKAKQRTKKQLQQQHTQNAQVQKQLPEKRVTRQFIQLLPPHFSFTLHLYSMCSAPWHYMVQKFNLFNIATENGYANISTNIKIVTNDAAHHMAKREHLNMHVPSFCLPGLIALSDLKKRVPNSFPRFDFQMDWFISKLMIGLFIIPQQALKPEFGYQFKLKFFQQPSKKFKQKVLQESQESVKPLLDLNWILGVDEYDLGTKILMHTTLGFDAQSIIKQQNKYSYFTSMLIYPFVQFEKELKFKQISGQSYMGCLRQILTQDSGVLVMQKDAPVGSIIRDDYIPKLSLQEIIFILTFSMNDVNSSGLLSQSQIQTITYTDRLQSFLLDTYEVLARGILGKQENDSVDLPQQIDEYKLMWVLNNMPLFKDDYEQDIFGLENIVDVFEKKAGDILNWSDLVQMKYKDDEIQAKFIELVTKKSIIQKYDQEVQKLSDYLNLAMIKYYQILTLRIVQYVMDTVNLLLFRSQSYIPKVDPLQTEENQTFMAQDGHCNVRDCQLSDCEVCAQKYVDAVLNHRQFLFCDFCQICQDEICEKILKPLAKTELYGVKYHQKLIKRSLKQCQCGEDVIGVISQAGFMTQDFVSYVLSQETQYYGSVLNNEKIKMPPISARACFVKYQKANKDYTAMMRLRTVADSIYSIGIIKARLNFMGLSLPFTEQGISKKFWLQSRIITHQQQLQLLTTILKAKHSAFRTVKIYNYNNQIVWTADKETKEDILACPQNWSWALLQ
ncbi:Transmembrane_domain-containing protein [Hexamita inflata]|uniref:Transmembrane domain-containing protein n=1 Tax=Hexamita inflata TaxID=28002 RepID=A0AA86NRW4_9EUKA|nr:Transmembrane domain-containing protein [Hexamita inflata]